MSRTKLILFGVLLLAVFLYAIPAETLGGDNNPALAEWYEEASAYYNAVMSGATPRPPKGEWTEFINQMKWAHEQLYGRANWGDQGKGQNAFGGVPGPMNNWIYNEEAVRIAFVGDSKPSDIWSNDVTLDVAPLSAKVNVEITTDTRLNPPEEVIKIIVKDPATGKESVYFIHDHHDAKIKINVHDKKQVIDQSGIVKVGTFRVKKPGIRPILK